MRGAHDHRPARRVAITVILDRSGSMNSVRSDMEGAFDAFIAGQRAQPGECTVSLHQFHYNCGLDLETVYEDCPLATVPRMHLIPGGGTPLLDAIGTVLTTARARRDEMDPAQRPHPIVVIITDGLENSSCEWTAAGVRVLTRALQDEGWLFTYLGANQDAFSAAGLIGVPAAAVMDWAATPAGTRGMAGGMSAMVSRTRDAYASSGDPVVAAAAFSYTPGERADAEGDEDE